MEDAPASTELVKLKKGTCVYRGSQFKNPFEYETRNLGDCGNWFAKEKDTIEALYAKPYVHSYLVKEDVELVVITSQKTHYFIKLYNMTSARVWGKYNDQDKAEPVPANAELPSTNIVNTPGTAPLLRNTINDLGYLGWSVEGEFIRPDGSTFHNEIMFVDPTELLAFVRTSVIKKR
jgi:hypothetical protein